MRSPFKPSVRLCAAAALLAAACAQGVAAQTAQPRQPAAQDDEVVRVNAELVQTDVTVVDKRGRFVENLKPEQFELKVDGRAVPLSFFETGRGGGAEKETKPAPAGGDRGGRPREPIRQTAEGRGRVIFFFVDD